MKLVAAACTIHGRCSLHVETWSRCSACVHARWSVMRVREPSRTLSGCLSLVSESVDCGVVCE